jgi:Glu-tRNA(Gln) amidotransferase subunit E-like FAD-binding protein
LEVFRAHAGGRLAREGVLERIEQLLRRPARDNGQSRVDALLNELKIEPIDADALDRAIGGALADVDDDQFATPQDKQRCLMGRLMRRLVGRVEGRRLAALLEKRLSSGAGVTTQRRGKLRSARPAQSKRASQ